MDVFFTAPIDNGVNIATIYQYFNGGVYTDYSFSLFLPTTGQTIADLEVAALASEVSYRTAHSYTVSNLQKWYTAAVPAVPSSVSRSIVTGTGAVGFQPSATRNTFGNYSVTIAATATIASGASGTVVLEIAPTNSATPSDWVEVARFTNGQVISLAIVLQSVQTLAGTLNAMIPAGYYAKLRSINNTGTPTYTYNCGQEILL